MKKKGHYDIYEAKYLLRPMKREEMENEKRQIEAIQDLQIKNVGFLSIHGFEEVPKDVDCIAGEDLYF
ncbi:MAG: hypothetical protein ACI32C_00320 [Candidatus Enteromonas sp.]